MMLERWDLLQRLFQLARDLPAHERDVLLARECADEPTLRPEVESLLAAATRAGGFLEEPALGAAARALADSTRPIAQGDSVGPYRLVALVGRGGMGEVWRAHDTRLGRDVALKFCAAPFSAGFDGEARAVAALNHPHVCQLYDVGPTYLVMEFVEGQAPAGPLPLATVLDYGRQIADALEAAHDQGLVHRDLKPANIKVRPDGTLKVLDFGIATWVDPRRGGTNTAGTGAIVGTPAWMSPEQFAGQGVDKRADIWAFGLLLFTLATGRHPFARETVAEAQLAVQTVTPDWEAVPFELRRLIRKCLAPDPKQRLRDLGDAWDLLDSRPATSRLPLQQRLKAVAVVGAALAVALALGWSWGTSTTAPRSAVPVRLDLNLGADLPLDVSGGQNLALSPDGSTLAFVSRGRLFVRALADHTAVRVGVVQGAQSPFFSPDGRWIGFFAQGQLRKIAVNGGAPVDLSPTSAQFAGAAWGPDDTIVAPLAPAGPLQVVPASGGAPRPLTTLDHSRGETTHRLPQFLPGGKAIVFTSHNAITGFDDADIDVVTLADGARTRLIHGGTSGRYVASGHLLYVSRGALYAVPFDADRLELRGEPVQVAGDVAYSLYGAAQLDVDVAGTLVFASGGAATTRVTLDRLDASGGRLPFLARPGTYLNPRVSPDGQQVLLSSREPNELALTAFDIRRDVLHPLAQYQAGAQTPWAPFAVWSPDGRFVVFRGDGGTYWLRAGHNGAPQRLTTSTNTQTPASFSPDGRTLAYYEGAGLIGPSDIWTIAIISDGTSLRAAEPRPFVATAADESHPVFSRDGRWVAYAAAGTRGTDVQVRAWPDDGRLWQASSGGGSQPIFSRSRDELYFLNEDRQVMAVRYRMEGGAFAAERPRRWSEQRVAELGATFWSYDVLPGDAGLIGLSALARPSDSQAAGIAVIVNAFEYLRRLAPAQP